MPHYPRTNKSAFAIDNLGPDEVGLLLGAELEPSSERWHKASYACLRIPDPEIQLAVVQQLPDVITNRRSAYINPNSSGHLMRLYETILEATSEEVVAASAQWAGLLAVRSRISPASSRPRFVIGPERWPIDGWIYKSNSIRSANIIQSLVDHESATISKVATDSMRYWSRRRLVRAERS